MKPQEQEALRDVAGEVLRLTAMPEDEMKAEIARQVEFDEEDLEIYRDCGLW